MVEPTVNTATTNTPPGAEAQPPAGPTVADLQAKIAEVEGKYSKEIGDRDRGLARQAETLKQLNERLAAAEKAADSLARRTFGVEDETPNEYQQWRNQHTLKAPEQPKEPTISHEQAMAIGEMRATAKLFGVDYAKPPEELTSVINEVSTLFHTDPEKASEVWEKGLKKRDAELKAKAEAEAKSKKEEAEKKAKFGTRDTTTSTGGGSNDWVSIRDAFNKNPTDPVIRAKYMEARRARGI